ncbi:MAG: type IV secretion system DNA-binding domain-containing protein [bacterium]|nr:type IV secretion system DNA-binding domain-containing protein [bacterium]
MDINFFGVTNFRNSQRRFGIKEDDRRRHFYVVGKTGMGKTEMLKNMAVQDIQGGNGIGFVDPHGEAAEELLQFIPIERLQDVVYFNPADTNYPIAFNVMENVNPEHRHLMASGLMSVFKKVWPDVWSARMEYILNNTVLALLEYPGATLLGINRMLVDVDYRAKVIEKITDPVVKAFWVQEYARYTQRYEVEATAAIQNKVGQFVSNPLIRNIVGQVRSSFNVREVMDGKKIFILNLSKGRIGEDNSRLLGAMLITKIQLAAMSRVDIPESERQDFFLYIDEFQNFASDSFVSILSEARKYRLALILSHQYISQLDENESRVRGAVFGNVGTIISFRVGAEDAEFLEKEFTPEFLAIDFVNLGKYSIYVKLMIDGIAGRPFSAQTLPPSLLPFASAKESNEGEIINVNRLKYATAKGNVEEEIARWSEPDTGTPPQKPQEVHPEGAEKMLYDARCDNCRKDTKVVFEPDGKRKVYCKSCRKKLLQAKEAVQGSPLQQATQALNQSTQQSAQAPQVKRPSHPVAQSTQISQKSTQVLDRPMQPAAKSVSLAEAMGKEPTMFYPSKARQENQKRKEVDKQGLKEVLGEALKEGRAGKKVEKGELLPGETLKFS